MEEKVSETPIPFSELLKELEVKPKSSAYILIEAEPLEIPNIMEKLSDIENIKSADVVTGVYDIIVFLEGEDQNEIGRIVVRDIHSIKGVKKATTCMVVKL